MEITYKKAYKNPALSAAIDNSGFNKLNKLQSVRIFGYMCDWLV